MNFRTICRFLLIQCDIVNRVQTFLEESCNVPISKRSPLFGHLIIIAQTINNSLKNSNDSLSIENTISENKNEELHQSFDRYRHIFVELPFFS